MRCFALSAHNSCAATGSLGGQGIYRPALPAARANLQAAALVNQKGSVMLAHNLGGLNGSNHLAVTLCNHISQQRTPRERLYTIALLP